MRPSLRVEVIVRRASIIIAATLGTACGGDSTGGGSYVTVDSAGIAIIESRAPAWDSLRVDSVPALTIGSEEEGSYQFGFISDAEFLADGAIAVADFTAMEVRAFDSSGAHLATYGRAGEGPGEFRSITGIFDLPPDSIAAYDQRLRRLTILHRASGTARLVQIPGSQNLDAFGLLDDRTLLLYNPGQYRRGRPSGLQWDTSDVIAVPLGDDPASVVARLPSRERLVGADGQDRALIGARWAVHGAGGAGFWWTNGQRYEITFYDGDGAPRRMIRRPVAARAIDEQAAEAYRSAQYEVVRRNQGEGAVAAARRRFDEGATAEHVPLFAVAFVDRDGRLWLGQSGWPDRTAGARWSIFDRDGVWLGDAAAPERFRPTDASGDRVLGIWRDMLDVQHVRVYRLRH